VPRRSRNRCPHVRSKIAKVLGQQRRRRVNDLRVERGSCVVVQVERVILHRNFSLSLRLPLALLPKHRQILDGERSGTHGEKVGVIRGINRE